MHIKPVQLNNENKLIHDYRNQTRGIIEQFSYNPFASDTYEKRLEELTNRSFDRAALSEALRTMNDSWGAPEDTLEAIDHLKDDDSTVVIGGQQAGLLSGPMYTIHKIISIIQFARDQEENLGVPVIPVFWIAGEDHDFAEINHVFMPDGLELTKQTVSQEIHERTSISDITMDNEAVSEWVDHLFSLLEETEHTKDLYRRVHDCFHHATTYTDFFARFIFEMFAGEGLVLMDAHDHRIRELETDFFLAIIEQQPSISEGIYREQTRMTEAGYALSLNVERENAHLFYHLDGERVLLMRDTGDNWVGKQNEVQLTTQELLDIADESPHLLSTNVVTRPLMQDLLFPTLAFIGGPGEVGYWSVLEPAFHALSISMPPVVPRLSFTLVDSHIQKLLDKYGMNATEALEEGPEQRKREWLAARQDPAVGEVTEQVKEAVVQAHEPLREVAQGVREDLGKLADRNREYLLDHISFMEQRIVRAEEEKYEQDLQAFDEIKMHLLPHGELQERIWNPLFWLNEHGTGLIHQLTENRCSTSWSHHMVFL